MEQSGQFLAIFNHPNMARERLSKFQIAATQPSRVIVTVPFVENKLFKELILSPTHTSTRVKIGV